MKTVLLDSNVYRKILVPSDFQKSLTFKQAEKIHNAIKNKTILAFLSETIFSVEAIEKKYRKTFLSDNKPKTIVQNIQGNDKTGVSMSIGPSTSIQLDSYRQKYLDVAKELNVKIISYPRIGFPKPELPKSVYAEFTNEKYERSCRLSRDLEEKGYGIAQIKKIGEEKYGKKWWDIIREKDSKDVAKAFSEWADGDSISLCYGYSIDYFCTEDKGKSALEPSILSETGKKWLLENYNIKTCSIIELCDILKL